MHLLSQETLEILIIYYNKMATPPNSKQDAITQAKQMMLKSLMGGMQNVGSMLKPGSAVNKQLQKAPVSRG